MLRPTAYQPNKLLVVVDSTMSITTIASVTTSGIEADLSAAIRSLATRTDLFDRTQPSRRNLLTHCFLSAELANVDPAVNDRQRYRRQRVDRGELRLII